MGLRHIIQQIPTRTKSTKPARDREREVVMFGPVHIGRFIVLLKCDGLGDARTAQASKQAVERLCNSSCCWFVARFLCVDLILESVSESFLHKGALQRMCV